MANFNVNKIILGGRLTGDPELKQTQSGVPVASFSIAVNRKYGQGEQKQTDFFNVTAWRATAGFVSKFFRKGSSIFVVGSLQNRMWTDQQGQKRYATDVVADEAYFVDSKGDASAQTGPASYTPDAYQTPAQPQFETVGDDDDLPF